MCEKPLQAWLDLERTTENGKHPVLFRLPDSERALAVVSGSVSSRFKEIALPCGKCFSCRRDRAWELTVRAVFESRCYDDNTFLTLTVSDQMRSKVFPLGLRHRPWQLFAKRLRKKIGPFRFLMCAEYGSKTERPHYHAIIFGHDLSDIGLLPDGTFIPSLTVAECWTDPDSKRPYGHIQAAPINDARIAYVAGYTLKDFQLGRDRLWYENRCLPMPYVKWSRNPGLGSFYFEKFCLSLHKSKIDWHDCQKMTTHHFEAIFGVKKRYFHSRFFLDKLALRYPELYDKIKADNEKARSLTDLIVLQQRIDDGIRRSKTQQYLISQKTRDLVSHNAGNVNSNQEEVPF